MVVQLGQMQLPAPEMPDPSDDYFAGTISGGGLWTALTRASDHDHTGGVNGKPISIASIPDGSITTSKLDPSVLAPYSLTDGSKPYTGQLAMNADAIVRNTLYFGAKPAGVADTTLQRAGGGALRLDNYLGIGGGVSPWGGQMRGLQFGEQGALVAETAGYSVQLRSNSYFDGTDNRALAPNPASLHVQGNGDHAWYSAPAVAAGAVQAYAERMRLVAAGTLSLTPAAGAAALSAAGALQGATGADLTLRATGTGAVLLDPGGGGVWPYADNAKDLGHPAVRWKTVYAVNGTIQTSAREAKEDVAPLDPAAALAAVLATDPVTFTYTAPPPTEAQYALPDDPEEAERVLLDRLTNGPLLAAARQQAGFVLQDTTGTYATDPLFETGEGQSNAANSVGILLAAVHEIDRRLTALGG